MSGMDIYAIGHSDHAIDQFIRKLTRLREEHGGWWEPEAEGWLYPALFRYVDEAPDEIYVKAEAK